MSIELLCAVIGIIGVATGSALTFIFTLIQNKQQQKYEDIKYRREQRVTLIMELIECISSINNSLMPPHSIVQPHEEIEAVAEQFLQAEKAYRLFWNTHTGKLRLMLHNDAFLVVSQIDETIIDIKLELDLDYPHFSPKHSTKIGKLNGRFIHLVRAYTGLND